MLFRSEVEERGRVGGSDIKGRKRDIKGRERERMDGQGKE